MNWRCLLSLLITNYSCWGRLLVFRILRRSRPLFDVYLWIKVSGLCSGFISKHVAEIIRNALREFVKADPKNYEKPQKKFMQLRYLHDVRRPIQ